MSRQEVLDPDPRRRRHHRGPRRGIEPKGLKRWRLAHRFGTHDPGRRRRMRRGARGGHYFIGPKKRRYDPGRRMARLRGFGHRAGSKVEHGINKYGSYIGGLIAFFAGLWTGWNEYSAAYGSHAGESYLATTIGGDVIGANGQKLGHRVPEIAHLVGIQDDLFKGNTIDYLKYKFLGYDMNGNYVGSAWVIPFWASLAATIAGPIAKMFTKKGQRFLRPISKIGKGALIMSTIGALALPGSPNATSQAVSFGTLQTVSGQMPYGRGDGSTIKLV